jgi:hypothetical protein
VLLATVWYPQYLVFAVVPIVLLIAHLISIVATMITRVLRRLRATGMPSTAALQVLLTMPLVAATVPTDLALIRNPPRAGLPPIEHTRYISGWSSGYGLPELADFLAAQARQGAINVVRFDLAGPTNGGVEVYLDPDAAIDLHVLDSTRPEVARDELVRLAGTKRTLLISDPRREAAERIATAALVRGGVRIWQYDRPGSESSLEVWDIPSPHATRDSVAP